MALMSLQISLHHSFNKYFIEGGEITQTLYAHTNKRLKKTKYLLKLNLFQA
jgi:hypothetical protein